MELARVLSPPIRVRPGAGILGLGRIQGKQPLFTSPFGDVFFQAQDGFWFLDLLEGTLTRPWPDADALQAELNTAAGQDRYLMAGLAFAAERQGIIPSARQVLSFRVAPVLGASIAVENIEVMRLRGQSSHITGQTAPPGQGYASRGPAIGSPPIATTEVERRLRRIRVPGPGLAFAAERPAIIPSEAGAGLQAAPVLGAATAVRAGVMASRSSSTSPASCTASAEYAAGANHGIHGRASAVAGLAPRLRGMCYFMRATVRPEEREAIKATKYCLHIFSISISCVTLTGSRLAATPS